MQDFNRLGWDYLMAINLPRVLIACPTSDVKEYAWERYAKGLCCLSYSNFDIAIDDNSKSGDYFRKMKLFSDEWNASHENSKCIISRSGYSSPFARQRIVNSRNILRQKFLNGNYDYFFSLEQDVVSPTNVVERLLEHGKKIVSAAYFTGFPQYNSVRLVAFRHITPTNPAEPLWDVGEPFGIMEVLPARLMDVSVVGLGGVLIHRSVLEKVSFRYDPQSDGCDDMFFCHDARKEGEKIFLDSSQLCQHYFDAWGTEYRKKGIY